MKSFAKMRTITTLLSVFLLLLAFGSGKAQAQDETTVSISTVSAEDGENVSVPVTVENFNNVGAITLVINYDPSVLTFEGLQNTPRGGFFSDASNGELTIGWFESDPQDPNPISIEQGTLLDLQFTFAGGSSDLAIDESGSEIADIESNVISTTFNDGVVSGDIGELSLGVVQDASPGEIVNVALSGSDLTGVGAVSIFVGFDSSVLRFEGLDNEQSGLDLQASAQDGVVTIGGIDADLQGVDFDGTIVELTFTFLGGSSPLIVQADSEINDTTDQVKPFGVVNGSVTGAMPLVSVPNTTALTNDTTIVPVNIENLSSVGSLTLRVQFDDFALDFVDATDGVQNFNLTVNQNQTGIIEIQGFSITGVDLSSKSIDLRFVTAGSSNTVIGFGAQDSEVTTTEGTLYNVAYQSGQLSVGDLLLGDVQGNGIVDAGDASLVLQYVVDARTLNEVQLAAADVSGDDQVLANDASFILQFVVGLIDQFPAEEESSSAFASKSSPSQLSFGESMRDGDRLSIPVQLTNVQGEVTAAQFTVRFDPAVLTVEEVAASLPSNWTIVDHASASNGVLKVAMAGVKSIGAGHIATLTFQTAGNAPVHLTGSGIVNAGSRKSLGDISTAKTPSTTTLNSNYPNPFRGTTTISYGIPSSGQVLLEVYNVTGQKVATLVNQKQGAGTHQVNFNAAELASGMYMYRLTVDDVTKMGRMTIVK